MREMGGEFAREYPKIAGRLGLEGFECADPYVERLLEGFGFLAGRVQLKMDAEFPALYPASAGDRSTRTIRRRHRPWWWPSSSRIRPRVRWHRASWYPRDSQLHSQLGKGERRRPASIGPHMT